MTKRKLEKQNKKTMVLHNMRVFGNQRLGIHGHELPKFSETGHKFWTFDKDYNRTPTYASQSQMLISHGLKSKHDKFRINDHFDEPPEIDQFK